MGSTGMFIDFRAALMPPLRRGLRLRRLAGLNRVTCMLLLASICVRAASSAVAETASARAPGVPLVDLPPLIGLSEMAGHSIVTSTQQRMSGPSGPLVGSSSSSSSDSMTQRGAPPWPTPLLANGADVQPDAAVAPVASLWVASSSPDELRTAQFLLSQPQRQQPTRSPRLLHQFESAQMEELKLNQGRHKRELQQSQQLHHPSTSPQPSRLTSATSTRPQAPHRNRRPEA